MVCYYCCLLFYVCFPDDDEDTIHDTNEEGPTFPFQEKLLN